MAGLPINLNDLINATTIESERIEFKESWNPEAIMHTLCAYANDINNLGGGYIIIGIAEKDGMPVLPPEGLVPNQIDSFQKKLVEIGNKIIPPYSPIPSPEVYQGKHILVLRAPGGDNRPYKCPVNLGPKPNYAFYIRKGSATVRANTQEEHLLYNLANKVPFDDRVNHLASIEDLKLPLITAFLKEVGSDLYSRAGLLPFVELCQQLQIVKGPTEYVKPVNVGLLLFNDHPIKFFRGARIDVVKFLDNSGDKLEERTFEGPIQAHLTDALQYIQNNIIASRTRKIANQAEAIRYTNYPYAAIEESLANAVFHRSYEVQEPIEVSIWPNKIEILSFPGPEPPVDNDSLKKERVIARTYRNRRIGDFLKELRLTEGRATGILKIRHSMAANGSPPPVFETDNDKTYFLVTLPMHPDFVPAAVAPKGKTDLDVLAFCLEPKSRTQVLEFLGAPIDAHYYRKHIKALIDTGLLAPTQPDKPTSNKQTYITTNKGKALLDKNP